MMDIVKSETSEKFTVKTNNGFADFYQLNKLSYNQYQKFCDFYKCCIKYELKGVCKSSFSLLTTMLEKASNAFSPNLNFLQLPIFKMLQLLAIFFFLQ